MQAGEKLVFEDGILCRSAVSPGAMRGDWDGRRPRWNSMRAAMVQLSPAIQSVVPERYPDFFVNLQVPP